MRIGTKLGLGTGTLLALGFVIGSVSYLQNDGVIGLTAGPRLTEHFCELLCNSDCCQAILRYLCEHQRHLIKYFKVRLLKSFKVVW